MLKYFYDFVCEYEATLTGKVQEMTGKVKLNFIK